MAAGSLEHIALDVRPGVVMESQSGLQNLRPRIYGALANAPGATVGAIVMHPASNFMGHYLLKPLAERGISCMALNSRYAGNDALLEMERVIVDLGAGVAEMRRRGCKKVILIGNSGGAALCSFYQAEAEHLTATHFVGGEPTGLTSADLPLADGIVLSAAHLGRQELFLQWLDPAVTDETKPDEVDPTFDLYDGPVKPPFTADYLAKFKAAQLARRDRIEAWVENQAARFKATPGAPSDRFFLVHRTHADPRCLDLSIDANDRAHGSVWGDPRTVNLAANSFGRVTSIRAFRSQLSSRSKAGGPENLARTSVPVLLLEHTADQSTFPSTREAWKAAAPGRLKHVPVQHGDHYLVRQPSLVEFSADAIADWIKTSL